MATIDVLASKLAEDTMKAQAETGNDRLFMEVGEVLAAASQSLEEAYLMEVRVRMAERAARKFLIRRLHEERAKAKAGASPGD